MTIARRLRAAISAALALVVRIAATREGAHPVQQRRAGMRFDGRDGRRRDNGWHARIAAMRTAGLALAALLGLTAWPGGEAGAQALDFAVRAGGAEFDGGYGIAVDGAGGSWVTGPFRGDATFGTGEPNETTLTSAGSYDLFVAHYNADGTLDFAVQAGGLEEDSASGIAVDGAGGSWVTGYFRGEPTFGVGETNETTLTSAGSYDLFVAHYNADGTLDFAVQAGGLEEDSASGIAVDGAGGSWVTGHLSDEATFGAGEANETTLTSAGDYDAFVARYNADGTLDFAVRAGGAEEDAALAIAVDGAGGGWVTGRFRDEATFGEGEANETTLTSVDGWDAFVARFAPDRDGDGITDEADNCPLVPNPDQTDTDGGGSGDACDADDDGDGIDDEADNCPFDANADQADADDDGRGDVCDGDLDGDGVLDDGDQCLPTAAGEVVDATGCSIADLCPCEQSWNGHEAYLACVVDAAGRFVEEGLIAPNEGIGIALEASEAKCGKVQEHRRKKVRKRGHRKHHQYHHHHGGRSYERSGGRWYGRGKGRTHGGRHTSSRGGRSYGRSPRQSYWRGGRSFYGDYGTSYERGRSYGRNAERSYRRQDGDGYGRGKSSRDYGRSYKRGSRRYFYEYGGRW